MKRLKIMGILLLKVLAVCGIINLCLLLAFRGIQGLLLQPPHRVTETWQVVTINSIGTFRIPSEWNVEEHDEFLYITDRTMTDGDYTIYIIGSGRALIPSHTSFERAKRGETMHSFGFNNGATVSLVEYGVNGVIQNYHEISFFNSIANRVLFYELFVWSYGVVDEWYAEQIARTFSPTREGFDRENVGRLVE